ncbi:MAG TPA: GIY-YIG nuclease family protein [Vicinamibacterales bacterium]|nr:GIY-YIG nuclease family protein [Vicinamibacterales bacterium]
MSIGPGHPTTPFNAIGIALSPSQPAVYALCRQDASYVYFGQTNDLRRSLTEHLGSVNSCIHRAGVVSFAYELDTNEVSRIARQLQLIAMHGSSCNPIRR